MKYLLCENWGGRTYDAKKSLADSDDDLMCWAAAASNVLAWTGWGFPEGQAYTDETSIFKHFQNHWLDTAGHPDEAWKWWFNGDEDKPDRVNVPGGGGFWKSAGFAFEQYFHAQYDRREALPAIDEFLRRGYGLVLELVGQGGGHMITCWGCARDDQGHYTGIYVTDSDDPSPDLRHYDVWQDTTGQTGWARYRDWWYFTYHTRATQYLLGTVYALDRRPGIRSAPPAPTGLRIVS
ncbi:MAG: IdeS/Mac family cysteine endopeptidase [Thermodesulfobacteriota bacterium]